MDKTLEEFLNSLRPEEKEKLMRLVAGPKSTTPRRGRPRFIPKPRPSKEVEVTDTYICALCGWKYTSTHTYLSNESYITPRTYTAKSCMFCKRHFVEMDKEEAVDRLIDYIEKLAHKMWKSE